MDQCLHSHRCNSHTTADLLRLDVQSRALNKTMLCSSKGSHMIAVSSVFLFVVKTCCTALLYLTTIIFSSVLKLIIVQTFLIIANTSSVNFEPEKRIQYSYVYS